MRFTKTLAATLAIGAAAACVAGNADAGWRYYPGGWYHGGYYGCCAGAAVGAGIVGFAAGAVVGSALAAPAYYPGPYYAPAPVYVAPPVYAPAPVVAAAPVVYQAWTPGWVHSCAVRYRTFDPRTGYYVAVRGVRRFCR